jgi:hypothetical protein
MSVTMLIRERLFAQLSTHWMNIRELETKSIVTVLIISFILLLENSNFDRFLSFLIFEYKLSFAAFVVLSINGNVILIS